MVKIATVAPENSQAWQAARTYLPQAQVELFPDIPQVIDAFETGRTEFALVPIYNTREGEIKDVQVIEYLKNGYWIDNVVLPIQLSLGTLESKDAIRIIVGTMPILKQCDEFIKANYPHIALMAVPDFSAAILDIKDNKRTEYAVIETEDTLQANGFIIRQRDVAPHNRTRFAIIGPEMTVPTGYDATALISIPLNDRVGLLYEILGEFSRRGINILDLQSENDVKTQKLKLYIEAEGHRDDSALEDVLAHLENSTIQEPHAIKTLGSYPRVDMRTKFIKAIGFIGSGAMSRWFADKLTNEGYQTLLCGRASELRPTDMIPQVDVVIICVPISATAPTIEQYGPLLRKNQALILLAGEAEDTISTALRCTNEDVEVMLVHNLWGPKTATMKDKNAAVVRTKRSGLLCGEFEAFLYKHGADIYQDTPKKHDLLMGVSQKLPTAVSMAMAMALKDNQIVPEDIASHATLTSLYGILAMARIHAQNPNTYAEILTAKGEGNQILQSFQKNFINVLEMAENNDIEQLRTTIETNRDYFPNDFIKNRMEQALAIDQTLGKMLRK
jgi:prephenate dehydratase/prephenate dehydrogenase